MAACVWGLGMGLGCTGMRALGGALRTPATRTHTRCAIHTPREPYVMDMDRQCLMITHSLADTEGRRHFYFYGHRLKPACCANVTGRGRFAFTLL